MFGWRQKGLIFLWLVPKILLYECKDEKFFTSIQSASRSIRMTISVSEFQDILQCSFRIYLRLHSVASGKRNLLVQGAGKQKHQAMLLKVSRACWDEKKRDWFFVACSKDFAVQIWRVKHFRIPSSRHHDQLEGPSLGQNFAKFYNSVFGFTPLYFQDK